MAVRVNAIVIGAGFSGLKAASDLAAAGKSVHLIEARERIGGRVERGELGGRAIDHGAQWVGPRHARLLDQARRLGRETYLQYAQGRTILSLDGKRSEFKGNVPRMPVLAVVELMMLQHRWDKEMNTLPPGAPWAAKQAQEWDSQTLHSWTRKNLSTRASRAFARLVPKGSYGADAGEVSYLWMLEMLRQSGGLEHLMSVEGGITDAKFKGGMYAIAQAMAEPLRDRTTLGAAARVVTQESGSVRVTTDKGEFQGDRAIVAVPPGLCESIHFAGGLPAMRTALHQRLPHSGMIKIHAAYKEPFWRHKGYTGQAASNDLPLGIVMEDTQDTGAPMLIGFAEGRHALELSALAGNERRARIVDCLVDLFGQEANNVLGYAEKDWSADEWARGYVGAMAPGVLTQYGEALRTPCGRLHWASTETATEWTGYVEGALEAGERAAREAIVRLDS